MGTGKHAVKECVSLTASAVAHVRKTQLLAEGDAGTEWVVPVPQQERALETVAQGGSPLAQVEQDHFLVSRENLTDLLVDRYCRGTPPTTKKGSPVPQRKWERTTCEHDQELWTQP